MSEPDIFSECCRLLTVRDVSLRNMIGQQHRNSDIRETREFSRDEMLILHSDYRTRLASAASQRAKTDSWPRCADETFASLSIVARVASK